MQWGFLDPWKKNNYKKNWLNTLEKSNPTSVVSHCHTHKHTVWSVCEDWRAPWCPGDGSLPSTLLLRRQLGNAEGWELMSRSRTKQWAARTVIIMGQSGDKSSACSTGTNPTHIKRHVNNMGVAHWASCLLISLQNIVVVYDKYWLKIIVLMLSQKFQTFKNWFDQKDRLVQSSCRFDLTCK